MTFEKEISRIRKEKIGRADKKYLKEFSLGGKERGGTLAILLLSLLFVVFLLIAICLTVKLIDTTRVTNVYPTTEITKTFVEKTIKEDLVINSSSKEWVCVGNETKRVCYR